MAGQTRGPASNTAARAMPVGGQTAVTCSATKARLSPSFEAPPYAAVVPSAIARKRRSRGPASRVMLVDSGVRAITPLRGAGYFWYRSRASGGRTSAPENSTVRTISTLLFRPSPWQPIAARVGFPRSP